MNDNNCTPKEKIMKDITLRFGLALFMVLTFAACSDPAETMTDEPVTGMVNAPCFDDGTCNNGLSCVSDICSVIEDDEEIRQGGGLHEPCLEEDACDEGLTCISERCVKMDRRWVPCTTNADCGEKFACHDNYCIEVYGWEDVKRCDIDGYNIPDWAKEKIKETIKKAVVEYNRQKCEQQDELYCKSELSKDDFKPEQCALVTELDLNGNGIDEINGARAPREQKIVNIGWITDFPELKKLIIYHNEITDITALSSLTKLEYLTLSDNRITDISPLSQLTDLTWLGLGDNRISDITAIASLVKLEWLNLGGNGLTDIDALSGLVDLRALDLHDNQIRDSSALWNLKSLNSLFIDHNYLGDDDIASLINNDVLTDKDLFRGAYNCLSNQFVTRATTSLIRSHVTDGDNNDKTSPLSPQRPASECQ